MDTETIELAVDGLVLPDGYAVEEGPPFRVEFQLERGERWPAIQWLVTIEGQPVFGVETTEPRLKAALNAILAELS